jgi:hypothetical protein
VFRRFKPSARGIIHETISSMETGNSIKYARRETSKFRDFWINGGAIVQFPAMLSLQNEMRPRLF